MRHLNHIGVQQHRKYLAGLLAWWENYVVRRMYGLLSRSVVFAITITLQQARRERAGDESDRWATVPCYNCDSDSRMTTFHFYSMYRDYWLLITHTTFTTLRAEYTWYLGSLPLPSPKYLNHLVPCWPRWHSLPLRTNAVQVHTQDRVHIKYSHVKYILCAIHPGWPRAVCGVSSAV